MPTMSTVLAFASLTFGMALIPGPNMIYLISRTVCQGKTAGFISLFGIAMGFVVYVLCSALGITAAFFAVPYAYEVLRYLGALYLLFLAWAALRPKKTLSLTPHRVDVDCYQKLFIVGFLTNLLNPKVAMLYLALLPQFIDPAQGSVFVQSLTLGLVQILSAITVQSVVIVTAGSISFVVLRHTKWIKIQRWVMGTIFAGLALRVATQN